jgi:hypothetical protein
METASQWLAHDINISAGAHGFVHKLFLVTEFMPNKGSAAVIEDILNDPWLTAPSLINSN